MLYTADYSILYIQIFPFKEQVTLIKQKYLYHRTPII